MTMQLPSDLEERVYERFDALVAKGDVFYEDSEAEIVKDGEIVVSFLFSAERPMERGAAPLITGSCLTSGQPVREFNSSNSTSCPT